MKIAIFILLVLHVVLSCNVTDVLDLENDVTTVNDLDYFMSKLYVYPNTNNNPSKLITELKWGKLYHSKISKNYILAWISMKPMGNNRLELGVRLLDTRQHTFTETPQVILFPESYIFPEWLTLKSPQLVNRIKCSVLDVNLDTYLGDLRVKFTKNFIVFNVKSGEAIGNLTWDKFISENIINNSFSDSIRVDILGYREVLLTAYNSLFPNITYHVGKIKFPEDYTFPYWFEHVNGMFYKTITGKFKILNIDITSTTHGSELLIQRHSNAFRICVNPEYIDCVFIKSITIYVYKHLTSGSTVRGIENIFLYKNPNGIEISYSISDGKHKKISSFYPYDDRITPGWISELSKHATSRDDLVLVDLDLSSETLPNHVNIVQDLNKYTLEPNLKDLSRIVAISNKDTLHFLSKPNTTIKSIVITYLLGDFWKIQINVFDFTSKLTEERWLFFQGKNYIKFLPPPNLSYL